MIDPSHVDACFVDPQELALELAREEFRELLTRLSAEDADLLRRRAEGYSYEELGQNLGARPNSVRVRVHRLIHELKAMRCEADGEGRR